MVRPTYSGPCEAARDLILKKQVAALELEEGAFLARHLVECQGCRRLSEGVDGVTSGLDTLGRADFTPRAELRDALLSHVRALKSGRPPSRILCPAPSRRSRRTSSRAYGRSRFRILARLVAAAAVAAAVLVAVGLWRRLHDGSAVTAAPERHTCVGFIRGKGKAELLREGRAVALRAGQRVLDGDRFRTDHDTQLAVFFRDGSATVLNRNTDLSVLQAKGNKSLRLRSGDIFVAVEKRSGQYFVVNRGLSDQVLVTGTAFEVSRSEEGTRLSVARGSVKFGLGEHAVTVTTKRSCMAKKGSVPEDLEPLAAGADVAAWRTNTPPVAEELSLNGEEGAPLRITLRGSDPERDPLEFEIVEEPRHGRLSGQAPDLVYIPKEGFAGRDSFRFRIDDGRARSKPARVSITVAPLPGPPVPSIMAMPTNGAAPLAVTFDASGSHVPLAPAKFSWEFGDGGVAEGARVEHVFAKAGSYTVKLTVTDARERSVTAEIVVRALEKWERSGKKKSYGKEPVAGTPSDPKAKGQPESKETGKPVKQPVAKGKDKEPPGQTKPTSAGKKSSPKKKNGGKKKTTKRPPRKSSPKKPPKRK